MEEKSTNTKCSKPNDPGTISNTVVGSEKPVEKKEASPEQVDIVFLYNRRFELKVGRECIPFEGRELKSIPKKWLDHSDFLQVKKYFAIKGVSRGRN